MAAGSWFGLPELGISEMFGGKTDSAKELYDYKAYQSQPLKSSYYNQPASKYTSTRGNTGGNTGGDTGGNTGGGSSKVDDEERRRTDEQRSIEKAERERAEAERKAFEAAIESEYGSVMGGLSGRESELRGAQPVIEGQITQGYNEVLPQIEYERGQRVSDLQGQQATAESQAKSDIGGARRLYNELISGASRFAGTSAAGAYSNGTIGGTITGVGYEFTMPITSSNTSFGSHVGSVHIRQGGSRLSGYCTPNGGSNLIVRAYNEAPLTNTTVEVSFSITYEMA